MELIESLISSDDSLLSINSSGESPAHSSDQVENFPTHIDPFGGLYQEDIDRDNEYLIFPSRESPLHSDQVEPIPTHTVPSQYHVCNSSHELLNSYEEEPSPPPQLRQNNNTKKRRREIEKERETSSSDHEDSTESEKKRKHCKVPLPIIIKQCLENPQQYQSAIRWLKQNETFVIFWKSFCKHYRLIGKSNAKDENIQNRFGRFKIKKSNEIPPGGYNIVYNMGEWYYQFDKKPEISQNIIIDEEFDKMFKESTLVEDILNLVKKHPHTEVDIENTKVLLLNESGGNYRISKMQLWMFNLRFGRLNSCVRNIRDFVNSGAVSWYHGAIKREEAEYRLVEYYRQTGCLACYLVRAVIEPLKFTEAKLQYIFAISFLCLDGKVRHIRLYTNKLNQLVQCVPYKDGQYVEKQVINFWQLFGDKGYPVEPKNRLKLIKEHIITSPNTIPIDFYGGYVPE